MKKRVRGVSPRAVAASALLLLAVAGPAASTQHKRPFIDQVLSGPKTFKPGEWLELTPARPLRVVRDTQELTLYPDPPIQLVFDPPGSATLIPSDGRSADIEAELIDGKGVTHRSRPGVTHTMTGDLKITTRSLNFEDLPRDAAFVKVRVRSSGAYPVKKILWRCYNWGEVHH